MSYQIFTRSSHVGGSPTPDPHPRKVCVVETIQEARDYCTTRNAKRSKLRIRDGFHHEFADLTWYKEAFE